LGLEEVPTLTISREKAGSYEKEEMRVPRGLFWWAKKGGFTIIILQPTLLCEILLVWRYPLFHIKTGVGCGGCGGLYSVGT
jgi:hypothetical protein